MDRDRDDDLERTSVRGEEAEETILVERQTGGADETIVVEREIDAETIVVDRVDSTVVVDRGSASEGTIAITRDRGKAAPSLPAGGRRRRRGMSPPPVEPGFSRGAIAAPGANAVLEHPRRDTPELRPEPAAPESWNAATRADAPAMPSVVRRTRRTALVALAIFVASIAVSIAGLVALALSLL